MNSQDLLIGETVIYKARLHWGLFVIPFLLFSVIFVLAIRLASARHGEIAVGVGAFAVVALIPSFVRYQTNGLTLTNKRVISRTGVASRRSIDIALTKIEGVSVEQNIVGQLFNYGTLVVRGTGGGIETFAKLAAPGKFSQYVHEQISR